MKKKLFRQIVVVGCGYVGGSGWKGVDKMWAGPDIARFSRRVKPSTSYQCPSLSAGEAVHISTALVKKGFFKIVRSWWPGLVLIMSGFFIDASIRAMFIKIGPVLFSSLPYSGAFTTPGRFLCALRVVSCPGHLAGAFFQ